MLLMGAPYAGARADVLAGREVELAPGEVIAASRASEFLIPPSFRENKKNNFFCGGKENR